MPLPVSRRELLVMALVCMRLAAQTSSQPDTGTITGTVVDPHGKPLPAVQITLSNKDTGERKTTTDCTGHYLMSSIDAGSYQLQFAAKGFLTTTKTAVYACPSRTGEMDATLAVDVASQFGLEEASDDMFNASPPTSSRAQRIDGTVRDMSGAVVAGVHILAIDSAGNHYETTSQGDGLYRFSNLPGGNYCLSFEAAGWATLTQTAQTGQTQDASLSPMTRGEIVRFCHACLWVEVPPPAHPEIALELSAQRSLVGIGMPLLLTVVLRNIADHPISVRSTDGPGPALGYDVYAFLSCRCGPGRLQRDDFAGKQFAVTHATTLNLLPGETLTDRLDLSKVTNLNGLGNYVIHVERRDTSSVENGGETVNQPVIRSNRIAVQVVPASVADACK